MTTTRQLLTGSLRTINAVQANEEPLDQDMDITLSAFNALVDSMANDLLNIYTFTPYRFLLTAGQSTYTLGPGGDWDTPRPMRIEQAKTILYPVIDGENITTNQQTLFMPLTLISDERYADIVMRDLQSSWPTKIYDNGAYPLRKIRVWPVPSEQYAVELWMWDPLATYDTLDQELNLPPGYERYLRLKVAAEIAPEFGKELSRSTVAALTEAEANVKRMNQQLPVTGQSNLGAALQGRVSRVSQRGH